ncbi:MAG: hypothetical protein ACOVRM_00830, partial [Planctomycetaceae bacterium]
MAESDVAASGDAGAGSDSSATDSDPAGCAADYSMQEALTEVFEAGGGVFAASHSDGGSSAFREQS